MHRFVARDLQGFPETRDRVVRPKTKIFVASRHELLVAPFCLLNIPISPLSFSPILQVLPLCPNYLMILYSFLLELAENFMIKV